MNAATAPAVALNRLGEELFHVRHHALLRALIDNISEGIAIADASGKFIYASDFARRIYNSADFGSGPPEEWSSRHGLFRTDEQTLLPLDEMPIWGALRGKAVRDFDMFVRNANVPRGMHVRCSCIPLFDERGGLLGAMTLTRDIDTLRKSEAEKQRVEQQLMVAERLSSLGMVAASVAHEINNPMASLMMNLGLALDAAPGRPLSEDQVQALREAMECTERIRDIIQDIKIFSRPEEQVSGPTELHRVLDSSLRMAHNHISHRARLVRDYQEVPRVHGNEARLGQIFLNLIINASQAIPEGHRDEHEIRVRTSREGDGGVRVEIQDTGMGIPPELHERIFEPFFTTKPREVGTGLGLSICRRLVTEMGGSIGVESAPGRGSIFWLRLREAWKEVHAMSRQMERPRAGLRLLVVDDEVPVGKALKRNLGRRYEVVALDRAREALDMIAGGGRFDAILCDLMMPEMTGPQFHQALSQLAPEQARRITFMTGGAFTSEARAFLASTDNRCVEKPLDLERLVPILEAVPQ